MHQKEKAIWYMRPMPSARTRAAGSKTAPSDDCAAGGARDGQKLHEPTMRRGLAALATTRQQHPYNRSAHLPAETSAGSFTTPAGTRAPSSVHAVFDPRGLVFARHRRFARFLTTLASRTQRPRPARTPPARTPPARPTTPRALQAAFDLLDQVVQHAGVELEEPAANCQHAAVEARLQNQQRALLECAVP